MILDLQNTLSDAQALSATAASTNSIDLGSARQIQEGDAMGILLTVDVAADFTTGDETYTLQVQTDDNSAFSSPTVTQSQAIIASQLTLGAKIFIPLSQIALLERYIRLNFVLAGTTPSVTVTAELQPKDMVDEFRTYPIGYTIS